MIRPIIAHLQVRATGPDSLVDPKWVFCYNSSIVNKEELK